MKKSLKFLALVLSSLTLASSAGFVGAAGPETSTETPTKTSAKTSTEFSDEEIKEFDSILKYLQQIEEVLKKEPEYVLGFRMGGKKYPLVEYFRTDKWHILLEPSPEYEFGKFRSYCKREHKEIPEILANDPGVFYIMKILCEINNNLGPGELGDGIPSKVSYEARYVSKLLYAILKKDKTSFFPEIAYFYVSICISEGNITISLSNTSLICVFERKVRIKTRT